MIYCNFIIIFYRAKSGKLECRNTLTPYERYCCRNACASHFIYNSCMYNLVISVIKAKFDGKNCVRTEWLSKVFFSGKRVLFVRKIPN